MSKTKTEWPKQSRWCSLYEYYGKAQGQDIGKKIFMQSLIDGVATRVKTMSTYDNKGEIKVRQYPMSWLDKVDFIMKAHESGAKSDSAIVESLREEYAKNN